MEKSNELIAEEKLRKYLYEKLKKDNSKIRVGSGTITDTLQLGLEEASQILREWEYRGIISIKGYDGANIKNFASPWLITINDVEFFK